MHVALVATYTHPIALGLRYISAFLKARGHRVDVFFMRSSRDTAEADFPPALLAELAERLRPVDLIGMSLMTNTFKRACVLTEAIRKAGIRTPVIWGGAHPTMAPEESLELADMVCIGEGEHTMLELTEALEGGTDPAGVSGLALRRNGTTIRSPVSQLHDDLDEYPFPDYDPSTHRVVMGDHFEPAAPKNLRGALHRYRIETTRGCPYSCTFCTNAAMMRIYKGKGTWVRRRSNENIIQEIEQARARFPTIEAVNIIDDLFFVRAESEMEEFSRMYEARVDLPLELDAFPNTITRGKVRSLARLPIALVSMGIQSGSPETLKQVYQRPTTIERIVEGINVLADHKIRAEYHYLVNNPFDSDSNRIETLRFAATYHRGPAILRIFPLQFYPGTPLYDRARAEGLIKDRHDSAYEYTYTGRTHLLDSGYLDVWLRVVLNLRNIGVPRAVVHRLIDVVIHPAVRRMLDRKWFPRVAYVAYRTGRFVGRKLVYQPFVRPIRYLRGKRRSLVRGAAGKPASANSRRIPAEGRHSPG
jgi:radical SAM superfamily enzyme YgiQ (UPF0313 family)